MQSKAGAIKELILRYGEIVESERNKENKEFWANSIFWDRDMWRGIPRKHFKNPPFTVAPENQFWPYVLDFSLKDYYSDPMEYLKQQLKMYIYKFENWDDNYYFDGNIYIWFSVVTELSLFGPKITFFDYREPWLSEGKPVLADKSMLSKLQFPDFFKSGFNRLLHNFYESIGEFLDGKLNVVFPNWARGPFCLAIHLRGMENLLMDTCTDPEFVHKLMRFIVDSQKNWIEERKKFLKLEILPKGKLYNDEVGIPMMSPSVYEEFILPYEIELSEFQNGITYWHSCNNTTEFFNLIRRIPQLDMVHISPWADEKVAAEVFKDEVALDKCLNPEQDVLSASPERMEKRITELIENFGNSAKYAIRLDGIEKVHDIDYDLAKIKEFVELYNHKFRD